MKFVSAIPANVSLGPVRKFNVTVLCESTEPSAKENTFAVPVGNTEA
jgi:hypothetical protein